MLGYQLITSLKSQSLFRSFCCDFRTGALMTRWINFDRIVCHCLRYYCCCHRYYYCFDCCFLVDFYQEVRLYYHPKMVHFVNYTVLDFPGFFQILFWFDLVAHFASYFDLPSLLRHPLYFLDIALVIANSASPCELSVSLETYLPDRIHFIHAI